MRFDQFVPEFVEVPPNAPPSILVPIDNGEPCESEAQVWPPPGKIRIPHGDYTFNREGRLVPIDSPEAVSYIIPAGMRVVMSESDPEDDSLADLDDDDEVEFDDEDDDDLDTLDDDDEDGDETCEHGKGLNEDCSQCDGEDEDDDLDDLDDDPEYDTEYDEDDDPIEAHG